MLSPKLLDALRIYWSSLRRKPKEWLFPGNRWHTASYPVTTKVLWTACEKAAERAGLSHRHIHPHTLRHCFATHLLEAGVTSASSPTGTAPRLHVPEATADEQPEAGLWTVESIALGLKMRWWANSIVKNI